MRERLNKIFAEYSELIDAYSHSSVREQNKDAIRITIEQILYYYEKKDVETAKKAIHHLHMEIAKLIAEINSKVCQINPDAGRSLVSDSLQYLEDREIKAKYGDAILGEFTEMEEMLKERTKVLETGFRRKDALGVKEEPVNESNESPKEDNTRFDIDKAVNSLVANDSIINQVFRTHLNTAFTTGRAKQMIQINTRKFTAFFDVFHSLWLAGTISKKHYQSEYDFIVNNFQINEKDISKTTISGAKNRGKWV